MARAAVSIAIGLVWFGCERRAAQTTLAIDASNIAALAVDPTKQALDELEKRKTMQLAAAFPRELDADFRFADRVEESRIRFRHQIVNDAGKNYKAVHYDHGNGLAAADVDGDGRVDLYFLSQLGGNELWRSSGDGTFENITSTAGVALADRVSVAATFADFDNDRDADLFVTTVKMGNVFFENDGRGRFTDRTSTAGLGYIGHSSGSVAFDYDRDGDLDLFVTNVGQYTTKQKGEGGYFIGHKDAFHGHVFPERTERSLLYKNLGGLRFEEVSQKLGLDSTGWSGDAAAFDADGDGFLDLYVLNMQGDDHLFLNQRGARFKEDTARFFPKTPWGSMGIEIFDFDNDLLFDVFVTDMHSDMTENLEALAVDRERGKARVMMPAEILQGAENNIFGNAFYRRSGAAYEEISDAIGAENYWPWGVSAGDFNADGFEDLFITASMNYPFRYGINSLLINYAGKKFISSEFRLGIEPRRDGKTHRAWFTLDCAGWDKDHAGCSGQNNPVTIYGALGSRSSVVFDLDHDGDLDIVTTEFNSAPQVLISDLAAKKKINWLTVELEGTRSNRDGLGARVELRFGANGPRRLQPNDGKSGYLSQSRLPIYFGLGAESQAKELIVYWPNGTKQVVPGPHAAGSRIRVVEP